MPKVEADPPNHAPEHKSWLSPAEKKIVVISAFAGLMYGLFVNPLVGPALTNFVNNLSLVLRQ